MPKYKYEGFDQMRNKVKGEIDATDERFVKRSLRRQGIRVTKVIAPSILDIDLGEWMIEKGLGSPFKQEDIVRFTKQLSTLINAGVPILECLDLLARQERNQMFARIIKAVVQDIGEGRTLHESLAKHKGFSKLYTSLVKAGEAAGILDKVLNKLADYMDKQEKLKKKIKGALTYPAIVCFVGIGVIIGLMVFVVPQFVDVLKESNQEIPWPTQFVMDVSAFMSSYFIHIMVGLTIVFSTFFSWKKSKKGKPLWDKVVLKAPIFGTIIIKGGLGGFMRTLSTMLEAGVAIIDALDICIETMDNIQMAKDLSKVKESVIKGKSMTEQFERITYFPPLVTQMIKVGESTGNLDNMMMKVSEVFEEETSDSIDGMTKLIEPLILVGLGGIIAFVLIAMYLPIFMSAGGGS